MKKLVIFMFTVIFLSACSTQKNTFMVDYLPLQEKLEKCNFAQVGEQINEKNFIEFEGQEPVEMEYKILRTGFESYKELFEHIDSIGFRAANCNELISFYLEQKERFLSGNYFIALGDPIHMPDDVYFPYIRGNEINTLNLSFDVVDKTVPNQEKVKFLLIKQ